MGICCQAPQPQLQQAIEIENESDQNRAKSDDAKQQSAATTSPIALLPSESDLVQQGTDHRKNIDALEQEIKELNKLKMNDKQQQTVYTESMNAMKQQINGLKKEIDRLETQKLTHLDSIKSLKQLKTGKAQIIHKTHAKPSFHKKTELQKQLELAQKEEEIKALKQELAISKEEHDSLITKHDTLITKTKTMTMNDDEIEALHSRLKRIQSQHNINKETYENELKLLKEKDPEFIEKIYNDRDQLQSDLIKLKKLFKQREHTLRIQLETLQRNKLKSQDIADLKDKNEDELREIVEKLRFTNRDLHNIIHENTQSSENREKEFEEQILALNSIIKDNKLTKTRTKRNSNAIALGALNALSNKKDKKVSILDDTKSILGMIDTMNKYQKMKKIGMPMSSIKNKMKLDGFTPSQIAKFAGEPPPKPLNGIDLSTHNLQKYDKMKKIGMPQGSVRNKMKMDGIELAVIATFFGEKIEEEESVPSPKPDMKKYEKMKKIGMPQVSIKNKMKMDGIDPYWIRDFFGETQPIKVMEAPSPKPDLTKYKKMKKVRLPKNSIKNKMEKDGIDPYWIRDFFGESQAIIEEDEDQIMPQPSLKPDMKKYDKMKKVGLPPPSIKNKMRKDGIHQYWICVFFGDALPRMKYAKKKKKRNKRQVKPLHWRKKSECDWNQTIWANIDTVVDGNNVNIALITTQKLITPQLTELLEKAFTSIRSKKKKKNSDKNRDETKEITLIDPKRAFNMIVGLRQFEKLGIHDVKIRNYLLKLDDSKLNIEMLENLAKFVPSNEELHELRNFKGNKERLGRAEKFVDVMGCLVDIKLRIDLWQFKMKFKSSVFEIESRINKISTTLNTLKTSSGIAAFLKVCLIIGNWMNEGTNRGAAKGIKLESIDRFASLKTADNTMTMLMFIIAHIEKNKLIHNIHIFPDNELQIVKESKKIESKTIRDSINDMHDSLERIGKRITRAARNLHQIQAHFHKSAGNALKVLGKLRKNVTKLHNKQKKIAFSDALFDDDDHDEHHSKYRGKQKAPKFVIIDPKYKGNKKIRNRKEREIADSSDYMSMDELLTRGETMIESDADFSDLEATQSMHKKTETGLRRKKKKLKKVKIRRLYRLRPKGKVLDSMLSMRTSKTIQKLRETRQSSGLRRTMSIRRIETKEDINAIPADKFESVMTGFHTMASNKVDALNNAFSNLKIFAGNVAVYFGEHDDLEWEELFKLFIAVLEQINKAKKQNNELKKKEEKKRKKEERERLKKERMAKKGLKPKQNNEAKSSEPSNILEEIKMKNAKGTLTPSKAKNDIVGYEKMQKR